MTRRWRQFVRWCHAFPGGVPLAYGLTCCALVWVANMFPNYTDAWIVRVLHNMAEAGVGLYAYYWAIRGARFQLGIHEYTRAEKRSRELIVIGGCALIIAGSIV